MDSSPLSCRTPLPEAEMRAVIEQVLQAAVTNGISGTAAPLGPPPTAAPDDEEELPVPKYPAAEAALLSGDLDGAIAGFTEALSDVAR
ncbi:MAG: hypothetical protein WKF82_09135 [Nocardioidaceae bacterium]